MYISIVTTYARLQYAKRSSTGRDKQTQSQQDHQALVLAGEASFETRVTTGFNNPGVTEQMYKPVLKQPG